MTWTVQFSAPLPGFPVLGDSMGWGGREGSRAHPGTSAASRIHPRPGSGIAWGAQPPQTHLGVLSHAVGVFGPALQLHQLPLRAPRRRLCRHRSSLRGAGASSGHPAAGTREQDDAPSPLHGHPPAVVTPLHPTSPPPRCQGWGSQSSGAHRASARGPARPRSPSPWHPAGAASPGWPRCSRAGAGCRGWRRRARSGRC